MEALGLVCLYGITALDDIRTREVRCIELIIFALIGIIYNLVYRPLGLLELVGGIGVGLAVLAFSILSKEKIGRGDAYIIMVTGLYLGFKNTLLLLWVSCIIAAITGMIMIRKYDNRLDVELPFVPFLLVGFIALYTIHMLGGILI